MGKSLKGKGVVSVETANAQRRYAVMAIESGMQPKVLQQLLGHASIKTTMEHYVHVTSDSLTNAVRQFEPVYAN